MQEGLPPQPQKEVPKPDLKDLVMKHGVLHADTQRVLGKVQQLRKEKFILDGMSEEQAELAATISITEFYLIGGGIVEGLEILRNCREEAKNKNFKELETLADQRIQLFKKVYRQRNLPTKDSSFGPLFSDELIEKEEFKPLFEGEGFPKRKGSNSDFKNLFEK